MKKYLLYFLICLLYLGSINASKANHLLIEQLTLKNNTLNNSIVFGQDRIAKRPIPEAPTNLRAEAISEHAIYLNWEQKKAQHVQNFYVERAKEDNSFKAIAKLSKKENELTDEQLDAGTTYYYRVKASNKEGNSEYSNIAEATTMQAEDRDKPDVPKDFKAVASSASSIDLSWKKKMFDNDLYIIEKSLDNRKDFALVEKIIPRIFSTTVTYTDEGLKPNSTYYYRVKAQNEDGESNYATTSATTLDEVPAAPSSFTAVAASSSEISLSWADNADNETEYILEWSTSETGPFNPTSLGADATTYTHSGLAADTKYFYRVKAQNEDGESNYATTSATTLDEAPAAPSSLTAVAASSSEISLSWTDNADNETEYILEWSTSETGPFNPISLGADATTYTHSGLVAGTKYFYRVKAQNDMGGSAYATASATTLEEAPAAPSSLTAVAASSSEISLSWTDNADNETKYILEWSNSETGPFNPISLGADATTYTHSGLAAGTKYFYRVKAQNDMGGSAYATASATTEGVIPAAPSSLTAVAASSSEVSLSWTDNAGNETEYMLEWSTSETGPFNTIALDANIESYTHSGLTPNTTYFYRVKAQNAVGSSSYATASATTEDVAPAAPSSLTAVAVSSSEINLSWTDNANNEVNYIVERSTSSTGTYSEVVTLGANITSYEDTGLTPNTPYFYRVKAKNAVGDSDYTSASATTEDIAPAAPSSLTANALSISRIRLNWTDNANNESQYIVERSATDEGPFAVVATLASNVTTYTNTSLNSNTTYFYRVKAVNAVGSSEYSSTAQATTDKDLPLTPSHLRSTGVTTSTIALAWSDNSGNETGFVLERSLDPSSDFNVIAEPSQNEEAYLDKGLEPNVTYFYRIKAKNADGVSSYGNIVSITTEREAGPPTAPTQLVASAPTTFQITLSWNDNADNETSYVVERSTSMNGPFSQIAVLPVNTEVYENIDLSANTTYYYKVKAKNIDGVAESNVAHATTKANPRPPTAPSGLTATAVSTVQINLSWEDNANSEANFIIERSTLASGPFVFITAVSANVTSYQNFGLSPNTRYYYRIQAQNKDGASAFSNIAHAKTSKAPQPPAAPSSLQAVGVSTAQINLTWQDNANNETGFVIERAPTNEGPFAFVGTVDAGITSFASTGLNVNSTYYYRVRSINNDGTSGYSNIASGTTLEISKPPVGPSNLVASGVSTTQINLTWQDNAESETNFEIYIANSETGPFSFLANVPANQTTYESTGLKSNTLYFYKVLASNGDGKSSPSNVAKATTSTAPMPPTAPDGLSAIAVSTTQINLKWNDQSDNETNYVIERSLNKNTAFHRIIDLSANDTTFENTGLSANTTYYYRIKAVNKDGSSNYSNIANATTLTLETPPMAPSDLLGKLISPEAAELYWTDNSNNEESFIIERALLESFEQTHVDYEIINVLNSNVTFYTDSTLEANKIYKYRVRAKNSDGEAYSNEILIGSPLIPLSFPEFFNNTSSDTTIAVRIATQKTITSVTFQYKGISEDEFKERAVTIKDDIVTVKVTNNDLDEIGLVYYFEASTADTTFIGNTGLTYRRYVNPGLALKDLKFGSDIKAYQMISIPLVLENATVTDVFEDDLGPYDPTKWRLFHYENNEMTEKSGNDIIEPGNGYWLIIKERSTLDTGEGHVVEVSQNNPFLLELKQGWNLIGNPYMFDISWSKVMSANNLDVQKFPLVTYSDKLLEADVLKVFQGGYVFAEKDTSIIIQVDKVTTGSNGGRKKQTASKNKTRTFANYAQKNGWQVDFTLTSEEMSYSLAGLGMQADAALSKDKHDRVALPRLSDFIDLNFEHPEYFAKTFTKDIVPLRESFIWDMKVVSSLADEPINLTWKKGTALPSGMNLILYDPAKEKRIDMQAEYGYTVSGNSTNLQVYFGNDRFIEKHLKPHSIQIGTAYPNPFNEGFYLPVTLPSSETPYTLQVHFYNSVGNEVIIPATFTLKEGFHHLHLSGNALKKLAPGLYFYKIWIRQQNQVLKEASGRILKE